MNWKAVAHSSIGVNHQKLGLPCQDFANFCLVEPNVIVGAISDGSGSAKHSEIGARIAVEESLKFFQNIDESFKDEKCSWEQLFKKIPIKEVKSLFKEMLIKSVLPCLEEQAKNSDYSIQDLSCTLSVFVATPKAIMAMQIGDGFMVVRSPDQDYQLLFKPDKGEYANQTTFVTSHNVFEEMQVNIFKLQPLFICVATDGLETVAIRLSDMTPFPPFFSPLEEYLKEIIDIENDKEDLIYFLDSERLNSRTTDDKTLLLCSLY